MTAFILVVHVFLAVGIVGLVLLQRGKGADAGAGFGAGASGTVFGARGSATVLSKATAILATLFFVTSLALAYLAGHRSNAPTSILERAQDAAPAPAPTPSVIPPPASSPPSESGAIQDKELGTPETPAQKPQ